MHIEPFRSHWKRISYVATASIFNKEDTRLAKWRNNPNDGSSTVEKSCISSPKTLQKGKELSRGEQGGGWCGKKKTRLNKSPCTYKDKCLESTETAPRYQNHKVKNGERFERRNTKHPKQSNELCNMSPYERSLVPEIRPEHSWKLGKTVQMWSRNSNLSGRSDPLRATVSNHEGQFAGSIRQPGWRLIHWQRSYGSFSQLRNKEIRQVLNISTHLECIL